MEHSWNISIFNIPGTLFGDIICNFTGNFFWIFQEYITGMFHEFSTHIYLSARNQSESLATNFSENKGYRLLQCFNMRLYKHLLTHIYPLQYAKKLSSFRCWWKFRIAESYFSNYWVSMVKNGQDLLGHETVKSGVSRK